MSRDTAFVDLKISDVVVTTQDWDTPQVTISYHLSGVPDAEWARVYSRTYEQRPPTPTGIPYVRTGMLVLGPLYGLAVAEAALEQVKRDLDIAIEAANSDARERDTARSEIVRERTQRCEEQRAAVQAIVDRQFPKQEDYHVSSVEQDH